MKNYLLALEKWIQGKAINGPFQAILSFRHCCTHFIEFLNKKYFFFFFGVCVCILCFYYMVLYMTSMTATYWMHFNLLKGIYKKTTLPIPSNTQVTTSWPDEKVLPLSHTSEAMQGWFLICPLCHSHMLWNAS